MRANIKTFIIIIRLRVITRDLCCGPFLLVEFELWQFLIFCEQIHAIAVSNLAFLYVLEKFPIDYHCVTAIASLDEFEKLLQINLTMVDRLPLEECLILYHADRLPSLKQRVKYHEQEGVK